MSEDKLPTVSTRGGTVAVLGTDHADLSKAEVNQDPENVLWMSGTHSPLHRSYKQNLNT